MNKGKRWCMRGARWMRKWSLNKRQNNFKKNATKHKEHDMLRMMEQGVDQWHGKDTKTCYMC